MICPVCLERWAPFPDGDFRNRIIWTGNGDKVIKNIAVSKTAEERRKSEFGRDEKEICEVCKDCL